MLIDKTHKKWLILSLTHLGDRPPSDVPYAAKWPHGPSGSSPVGLAFGIAGVVVFMIFAVLLGARKKVPGLVAGSRPVVDARPLMARITELAAKSDSTADSILADRSQPL